VVKGTILFRKYWRQSGGGDKTCCTSWPEMNEDQRRRRSCGRRNNREKEEEVEKIGFEKKKKTKIQINLRPEEQNTSLG